MCNKDTLKIGLPCIFNTLIKKAHSFHIIFFTYLLMVHNDFNMYLALLASALV